jgi:flagellar biosynthesis/type III secretory pathway protein FliH
MKPKDNNNSKRNMTMKRDWENILHMAKLRGERIAREKGYTDVYAEAFAEGFVEGLEEVRERLVPVLLSLGVPERIIQEALEKSLEDY